MIRWHTLAIAVLVATGLPVHAADWAMDAGASRLDFAATFERSAAPWAFRQFDARVRFDADKPAHGRLDLAIFVKSADMSSADPNKAIGGPEWFDFARFPRTEFHATDIQRIDGGRYLACGVLDLKGVQQAVADPFSWAESDGVARMSGELVVSRSASGIGTGEWASTRAVGADATIKFNQRVHKLG